jgi:hypothetical protein
VILWGFSYILYVISILWAFFWLLMGQWDWFFFSLGCVIVGYIGTEYASRRLM